jgi:hypothetical protein
MALPRLSDSLPSPLVTPPDTVSLVRAIARLMSDDSFDLVRHLRKNTGD